jgi:protein involved in polysaccharide export with SLBB domain
MIQTLFKNLLISALILGSTTVILSQIQNPTVNRNPQQTRNPKTKVENPNSKNAESIKKSASLNQVKTNNLEPSSTPEMVGSSIKSVTENNLEIKEAGGENLGSRSSSAKLNEFVKKNNAVAVSPIEVYKIGVGDVLFISLQSAPAKESTYFTVLNDGTIDYPLAGEMVQVLGLTTEQIEDTLRDKIKLLDHPQVSVKIREHNSHLYTVLGMVEKSGETAMQREALPLYVVRAEVGVQARTNRAVIKREGMQPLNIDLRDPKSADTLIYPKDIIEFIGDDSEGTAPKSTQFYFISGEVNSGGKKDFTFGITLTQAIIESGDLKRKSARKVVIRRKNSDGMLIPNEYNLKTIKEGKSADPVLQPGDTIEIGN